MNTILALTFVAVVASAAALPFNGRLPAYHQQGIVNRRQRTRTVPLNPFHGSGAEVQKWMNAVGPLARAPVKPDVGHGPSIYDNYHPPQNAQAVSSRTLWFEEFPHQRAVLQWQNRRAAQGLPLYKLISQRPGFAFYHGN